MTKTRLFAPTLLVSAALALAACSTTGASGSPAASASSPAASASADMSAAPSADASASASADASASASADASASASASAGSGDTGDLASKIPATVGDVAMSVTATDGEAYVRANISRQLAPILTALNKAPTDVNVVTATGSAEGGATLFIDAVQVPDADAEALLAAFQTAAAASPGTTVEATDVGGKSVVKATTTSYTLAVYASGDTLFYVQSPDAELVDQAIAALP
jgi:hypothetical protein